jgi:rare lipoprotein A
VGLLVKEFLSFTSLPMIKNLTKAFASTAVILSSLPTYAHNIIASVYHPDYHNGYNYCGGIYNHWGISAAHKSLPCGTKVKVTYQGKTITVPIRDRCQCTRIDLSGGAAKALGIPLNDIRPVTISY